MPINTPFDVVSSQQAVGSMFVYALHSPPMFPFSQTEILSHISNLPSQPFTPISSGQAVVAGSIAVLTGGCTFAYPQDATSSFDVWGIAVTYEDGGILVLDFQALPQQKRLSYVGDSIDVQITMLATRKGA